MVCLVAAAVLGPTAQHPGRVPVSRVDAAWMWVWGQGQDQLELSESSSHHTNRLVRFIATPTLIPTLFS